jgi:hypothetical protein
MLFVAPAIQKSKKFDEVQFYFYPFNYNSGYLRNITVGDFPIPIEEFNDSFDEFIKSRQNPGILEFINFIVQSFVIDKANPAYGFSGLFKKDATTGKNKKVNWATEDRFVERIDLVLNLAYGVVAGHPRYREPRVQVKIDTVPSATSDDGTIIRMHFFDSVASSYNTFCEVLQEAQDTSIGVLNDIVATADRQLGEKYDSKGQPILLNGCGVQAEQLAIKQLAVLESIGILKKITGIPKSETPEPDGTTEKVPSPFVDEALNLERWGVSASPKVLKYVISSRMPTLKYGAEASIIKNASLGAEADQKFATLQMSRRFKKTGKGSGLSSNSELGLIPFQVNPVNLALTTIGCPFFQHGQQFFFDFQSGTSIDNVYLVTGVEHKFTPGDFETSLKLVPTDKFGFFNSLTDTLGKIKNKIVELNKEEIARPDLEPKPPRKVGRKRSSSAAEPWLNPPILHDEHGNPVTNAADYAKAALKAFEEGHLGETEDEAALAAIMEGQRKQDLIDDFWSEHSNDSADDLIAAGDEFSNEHGWSIL